MGLFQNPVGYAGYPPNPQTCTSVNSTVRAATATEAATGTAVDCYISPATAQSATALDFASPPAAGYGSTTPRPVAATTISATTTIAAGTTLTAGTDITSTAGNVIINGTGKQLRVQGGAVTDFIGTTTLTNGVTTPAVANTNIAAGDRIYITRTAANASTAFGTYDYTISAGASFTSTAKKADTTTETGDQSTLTYFIVREI